MNFSKYLEDLEHLKINFFDTLIKLELPNLSCVSKEPCLAVAHGPRKGSEARLVFDYAISKGVTNVMKLWSLTV